MRIVAQTGSFTPGQVVTCVAMDAVGLTQGKQYTVMSHRDGWVQVVTDFGVASSYAADRFRYAERATAAGTAQADAPRAMSRPERVREQSTLRLLNRCRGNREVILIVDGNSALRTATAAQLRELNYTVLEAHEASQAWNLLLADTSIELLFTDVVLPGFMTGLHLSRLCQASWPDVKILLTAASPVSLQASDAAGAIAWPLIAKPYSLLELASHVRTLLTRAEEPLYLGPYLRHGKEPLFLGPYLRRAQA